MKAGFWDRHAPLISGPLEGGVNVAHARVHSRPECFLQLSVKIDLALLQVHGHGRGTDTRTFQFNVRTAGRRIVEGMHDIEDVKREVPIGSVFSFGDESGCHIGDPQAPGVVGKSV